MPVYAKNTTDAQRKAMTEFESISGFEMMHQDEFDNGEISFDEMWQKNQSWFDDVYANVTNIPTSDC